MQEQVLPSGLVIPQELHPLMDDEFMEAHSRWQSMTRDEVVAGYMPEATQTNHGEAYIFEPKGEVDEDQTAVITLAHGQDLKPSVAVRIGFLQDSVIPFTRIALLTHGPANKLTDQENAEVANGKMSVFYEKKAQLLDDLEIDGKVILGGWSLGALTALGIAGVKSDRQVTTLSADEAPNVPRSAGQLERDFVRSGNWFPQRKAMKEADLPVLMKALNIPTMAADYARFIIDSKVSPTNRALQDGMAKAGDFEELVMRAAENQPGATIKLSRVIGSLLTDPKFLGDRPREDENVASRLHLVSYNDPGNRKHSTVDNVVFHALTIKDAITRTGQPGNAAHFKW